MRTAHCSAVALIWVLAVAAVAPAQSHGDASEVSDLLDRAESLLVLGVVEKGGDRSFDEALVMVERAAVRLDAADLSQTDRDDLSLELEAVRENLELLSELSSKRFFGVFPLVRLTIPTFLADDGFVLTEELYHSPEEAAVDGATRRLLDMIERFGHPDVVLRSRPPNRFLEYVASEVLIRAGRSSVHSRRALVQALDEADLDAFDRGEVDSQLVNRLMALFDTVNLLVLSIDRSVEIGDGCKISLRADRFQPGEIISGDRIGADFNIRSESLGLFSYARDRRDQIWSIYGVQLVLFGLVLAWAALIPWSLSQPLPTALRLVTGGAFFVFGRVFIVVAVFLLQRFTPDPTALAVAVWWWPALLGLLVVPGAGLVGWIGQARLTDKVPGVRGARAVGAIFAMASLGACSYFVAPLLLLDGSGGFANFVPLLMASVGLAVLFGFAARTGPPVPHWFMIGPLLAAPLLGVCLMMASPALLWYVVGLTSALCLAAWFRHRYALAHGTEEPEPTAEEAAQADQQRLVKLGERLTKKL